MKRLLLCLATLLATLAGLFAISRAEDRKVDFDQGPDASVILEEAHRLSGVPMLQEIAALKQPDPLPEELRTLRIVRASGWVFGPWQPKIYYHPAYTKALQYPQRVSNLPPAVSGPLGAEWKERIDEGNGLLGTARELEPKDQKLYDDGVWLINEKQWLDTESSEIEAWRARYRERCWVQNPPSDCEDERLRLNARIDAFNVRVDAYHAKLADWKSRRDDIKASGGKLDERITAWGNKLDAYSARAEQALTEAGWTTVRFQAQGDDIPNGGKSTVADMAGPLCLEAGEQKLMELRAMLTASEFRQRDQALARAASWMQSVAASGGIQGPQPSKSFYNISPDPPNARVDIEVIRGRAFVYCPAALRLISNNE